MQFDPHKFVMVNRQNRPVLVYDRNKRPVTVSPISTISPHTPWDKTGTYVLLDPHFAQHVSNMGPLYTMARKEAEALLGEWFPGPGQTTGTAPGELDAHATPVGMSAHQQAAHDAARRVSAPGVGAPAVAAPAAAAVAAPVSEDPAKMAEYYTLLAGGMSDDEARATVWPADDATNEDDGDDVELKTAAELHDMKIAGVREYASNWEIKGGSKAAIIDQLIEGEYVAAEDE